MHYKVVPGASPERVVRHRAEGLLDAFVAAARELAAMGVTTKLWFLSVCQQELAAAVSLPVATSELMQAALIERLLPPGKRIGILTISKAMLGTEHLEAAGVAPGTPVVGTDAGLLEGFAAGEC